MGGPSGFSGVMNSALPRKRLIAHVLMRDDKDRVLLCETQFKSDWELPGGIVEPFESPRLGAMREVREELGIELHVGRLLVVDWMPPYLGWDDAIEMIFDGGGVQEDELATWSLQPSEIRSVRLCTLDDAGALITPLAHRRLGVALGLAPAKRRTWRVAGWREARPSGLPGGRLQRGGAMRHQARLGQDRRLRRCSRGTQHLGSVACQ